MVKRSKQELAICLEKLCNTIDLISGRDTEKTVLEVLIVFITEEGPIGGSRISERTGINRITCIHHIKKLESVGLIRKKNRQYEIIELQEFVKVYRRNIFHRMSELEKLIEELDEI